MNYEKIATDNGFDVWTNPFGTWFWFNDEKELIDLIYHQTKGEAFKACCVVNKLVEAKK